MVKFLKIDGEQKRWIPTAEIFIANGYSWSNVVVVDAEILQAYSDGPNITTTIGAIPDGGLIRVIGDIDVYIVKYVGTKKFKRFILNPSVFTSYQHLKWGDVIEVEKSALDSFTTSEIVRAANDTRIYRLYPAGDIGEKRWIKTVAAFVKLGFDWDSIYEINETEKNSYTTGDDLE